MVIFQFRFQSQSQSIVYWDFILSICIRCLLSFHLSNDEIVCVFSSSTFCPFPFRLVCIDLYQILSVSPIEFHVIFAGEMKPYQIVYGLCGERMNRQIFVINSKAIILTEIDANCAEPLVAIRWQGLLIIISENACINYIIILLELLSDAYTCLFHFVLHAFISIFGVFVLFAWVNKRINDSETHHFYRLMQIKRVNYSKLIIHFLWFGTRWWHRNHMNAAYEIVFGIWQRCAQWHSMEPTWKSAIKESIEHENQWHPIFKKSIDCRLLTSTSGEFAQFRWLSRYFVAHWKSLHPTKIKNYFSRLCLHSFSRTFATNFRLMNM